MILVILVLEEFTLNSNEPKAVVLVQSPGFGGIGAVVAGGGGSGLPSASAVEPAGYDVGVGVVGLLLHPEKLNIRAMKVKIAKRFIPISPYR
jgi:hypothetical protein